MDLGLTLTIGDKIDSLFYGFDTAIFSFFGAMQNSFLTIIAKLFTSFGDENFVVPIVVLAFVLCFFKKTRKYGFSILFAVMIGTLVTNVVLKPMVLRVRPYNTLQLTAFWDKYKVWYEAVGSLSESDYSFPSGHTTSAFEMAIAVFICLMADKKKKIAWIFPVCAVCVMGSRIYLMVHYPSDVIAGAIVGTLAGIGGYYLAKLVVHIFSKSKFLDKIDAEKLFKKGINPKIAVTVISVFCVIVLGISFGNLLTESNEEKCAYWGIYDCNNKAKIDDEDYPAIDGKNYCKIHWKEINERMELESSTTTDSNADAS